MSDPIRDAARWAVLVDPNGNEVGPRVAASVHLGADPRNLTVSWDEQTQGSTLETHPGFRGAVDGVGVLDRDGALLFTLTFSSVPRMFDLGETVVLRNDPLA